MFMISCGHVVRQFRPFYSEVLRKKNRNYFRGPGKLIALSLYGIILKSNFYGTEKSGHNEKYYDAACTGHAISR